MNKPGVAMGFFAALSGLLPMAIPLPLSSDTGGVPSYADLVYRPPSLDAPATRVGGGTRGTKTGDLSLSVLAPDHAGFTSRAQPTLYWFISGEVTDTIEVTITVTGAIAPLLELRLEPPLKPGFHALSLKDTGIALEPKVEYQWFVAIVPDTEQRSRDFLSGSELRFILPPDDLRSELELAKKEDLPGIYAQKGLWYDAIHALFTLIRLYPEDRGLRMQRSSLLEQAGLLTAAAFDQPQ